MEKFSFRFAVMLLAFSVGVAIASVFYFRTTSEKPIEIVENLPEPEFPNNNTSGETLEMVFVLDTTGSMGGLLEGAKQKIWGIVNEVMQKQSRPRVRVGLVAYRDRSDAYDTQILPLTEDLDKVYMTLMDYQAAGGGDTPENVRRALAESVKSAGWSKSNQGIAQIIFLVGDAPPQNYQEYPDVLTTAAEAVRKNMIVNTIQCGNTADTRQVWQEIAQRGQGKYFAIAQDGGVQTINTPYDEKLAELGRKIGETYLAYGAEREKLTSAQAATESTVANSNMTTNTARADRALNKAINEDGYKNDLLSDIEKGKANLESVKPEDLPSDLKNLPTADRKTEIEKRLAERKKIREQIINLSKQRETFIKDERKKSGKTGGFDDAVQDALSEQLKRRGIN
jgi:Mg-chelatase subunit ChlD